MTRKKSIAVEAALIYPYKGKEQKSEDFLKVKEISNPTMTAEQFKDLSDDQLLEEAKKMKQAQIIHAVLIGLMIGVALYSIFKNGFGFFVFLILYFTFKVLHKPQRNKALKEVLDERGIQY
ncbi:MAG: hypothetical protein KDC24_08740 [Saprospiraceae bacterium]|nr:hypothetical protein [Saprospiraceae bacterium]